MDVFDLYSEIYDREKQEEMSPSRIISCGCREAIPSMLCDGGRAHDHRGRRARS